MRSFTLALGAVIGLGASANASGTCPITLNAFLQGAQEVPANASPHFGSARLVLDTANDTLSYYISFTGVTTSETAAHIHGPALPGVNAGIVHTLPSGNPKVGVWNYPAAMEADILNGLMYINIHSTTLPGGEIRGQIGTHVAQIDGAQEVPANASAATGWGTFVIDTSANTLDYHIVHNLAAETLAHIHGVANYGVSAGVLHTLPPGSPKVGTWNYMESQEQAILRGLTYVNIHSPAFPAGEIRGQIVAIVSPGDASQEVPPNASTGASAGLFALDTAADVLGYDIRYGNITGTETIQHIHGFAGPGMNAGILHNLPAGTRKLGSWNYAAGQEANILADMTYHNQHTTTFPGGAVRGQIIISPLPCPGDLNCDGVVDLGDLGLVLAAFNVNADGDADRDGDTDLGDLGVVLSGFGMPCP